MKINKISISTLFLNISKKGFFHLLSANILIQIFAFASQLFVAGILSPEDIGRIKIIQTYLSIFSIIAGMGFNSSTLKICSENRDEKDNLILFKTALLFTLISSISVYALILAFNYFKIFSQDKLIVFLIPLGLFPLVSNSLFMVYISYFQSVMKIKLISLLTVSNKLISILAIIIFTYWIGIKGYYIAYNLSFIFMLIICVRIYYHVLKIKISKTQIIESFKTHWKYAKPSIFSNLLADLSAYSDILLIGILVKDMKQIGYYSFALTLIVALRLIPSTIQQISLPYFSSFASDKYEFLKVFKYYNKILYLVVFTTFIIFIISLPICINFIFTGKYDASIYYFYFLAIGWSIRQLAQLQSAAIFGLGKIHYNAYIALISLLFNITALCLSIYYFGLIGAAYVSIPSGIVFLISSRYYFQKAYRKIT